MKTKWKHLAGAVMISLMISSAATAGASMLIPSSQKAKENAKAPEKSPVISGTESGEWELQRVDFIYYAKPSQNPAKSSKPPKTESCYDLMGVKWKSLPVSYAINPTNPNGLTELFVLNTIAASMETWDDATSAELVNNAYRVDYSAQYGVQDFTNTIAFGDYADPNVIAVTSIWYTRRGSQIVEFDMLFNTRFTWGDAAVNPNVMDLQNIATHEAGHSFGMGDIYSSSCVEVSMYGYGSEGEIKKRTLESPDIVGLRMMYGL